MRVKVRKRVKRRRNRFRRNLPGLLFGLGLLALAIALDLTWSAITIRHALPAVRTNLSAGASALQAGDIAAAAADFRNADQAAASAVGAATHPAARIAALLPFIGDDVHAVRSLAEASLLAAEAGDGLVTAAEAAGWNGTSLPGYTAGGRFDPATIQAAGRGLSRAAALITRADDLLAPVELGGLAGSVRDAVEQGQAQIGERAELATKMAGLSQFLPTFLGANGERTWLIVMMNLSDPRGGGGYPGTYGLLHADQGKMTLQKLAPTGDLPVLPQKRAVAAPKDVVQRYAKFGATTHFISTTYSPDFPTDARLMLGIWKVGGGKPLDGVIAADAEWMSLLLGALGPVKNPVGDGPFPRRITSGNVQAVMDKDTFLTKSQTQSDAWQTAIGTALWRSLLTRPWPAKPITSAVTGATEGRHLMLYAADPGQQAILGDLGAAGEVRLTEDPPLVTFDGYTPNRAGYFARTSVRSESVEDPDGSKGVTVTVILENNAPTGPTSILLGGDTNTYNYPIGAFGATVSVYLPAGATDIRSTVKPGSGIELVEHEFGRPVAVTIMQAHAGQTSVATFTYTLPGPQGEALTES